MRIWTWCGKTGLWALFDLFCGLADYGGQIPYRFDAVEGLIMASEIGKLPRRLSC